MKRKRAIQHAAAFLALFLGVSALLAARPPAAKNATKPDEAPQIRIVFHKGGNQIPEATMRFGILLPNMPAPRLPNKVKQLTFAPLLWTSNTCLKIDGKEVLFGQTPGKWLDREGKLGKDTQGQELRGLRSTWEYPEEKITVGQTVEIVRGRQTGKVSSARTLKARSSGDFGLPGSIPRKRSLSAKSWKSCAVGRPARWIRAGWNT